MIKNHLKIALRSLINQRTYSLINIAGLSISLAVTLLMLLWVQDEWSMDKFHDKSDRIYRVKRTIPLEGSSLDVYNGIPYPVLAGAVSDLPEVMNYVPLPARHDESLRYKDATYRQVGSYGNAAYFEVFSFPILQGDIHQLDDRIDAIAISESVAEKIFGPAWRVSALGEVIHMHDMGDFSVEAVFKDAPHNSSVKNDFIYSFGHYLKNNSWMLEWTNSGMQGAILLAEGADPHETGMKMNTMFQGHQEGDRKEGILLQKYTDHYLYGQFDEQARVSGGKIEYVRTFGIAALLLLMIACINFVNLSTARASKRAKEVGVRKTVGAGKQSLIAQFMVEAGLITMISICTGYLLAEILLPQVRIMTGKMLYFDFTQPVFIIGIAIVFILTTLLAGAYPAFVLSSYRPINVLKGKITNKSGDISLRKGLVVIQFVLALLLIASALVVQLQVDYIKNKNLGITKDNILVIHQAEEVTKNYDVLRSQLIAQNGINNVTLAGPSPIDMQASTSGVVWPEKRPVQENIEFQIMWTASNFVDAFDIPLVAGRYYREGSVFDTTSVVFNERAIEIMGLTDPVGKSIQWWGKQRQIIGVVADFHNRSLYEKIEPAGFLLDAEDAGWLFIKVENAHLYEAIAGVEATFKEVLPDMPLHYEFLDEQYQALYQSEELTGSLAKYFAIFSIFLSCLGLLGLATFFAEQKVKEIGIRKVLGASVAHLIGLLSREFLYLVGIGLLIGIPVSWYLLSGWLGNFEYKVDLKIWMFVVPVVLAILVAGLTVGAQAIRAAMADPVESLRAE
jgi:ABC-type lipoprotein release transport system permease subunit